MNLVKAVVLKLISTLLFSVMAALIRLSTQTLPVGEVVFFRGAAAIIPVLVVYAWRRELASAVRMARPLDHFGRGVVSAVAMFLNFASLSLLPLVDAIAISFTAPLLTVGLAVIILKEKVRIYRWTAVAVGFLGVLVMLTPHLDLERSAQMLASGGALGVGCGLLGALFVAGTVTQTRRMTFTETTSAIVFYFSLFTAAAALLSLPFGWRLPTPNEFGVLMLIGILGGTGHIMLTDSFRYAPASFIAPFDYTAMIWAIVVGYFLLGELPTPIVVLGATIVAAAGLFVILRERQLGLQRAARATEGPPAGA